jgi:hypothetical protein
MRKRGSKRRPTHRAGRGQAGRVKQIRHLGGQSGHPQTEQAHDPARNLELFEEAVAFDAMIDQIEEAGQALELHWGAFDEMMRDVPVAMERAEQLFSEERFAPLHYTVADVQRAFEMVGYPSGKEGIDEEDTRVVFAASAFLGGDEDNRAHLARQLYMALPEYIAAGRYLDGWLIRHSAHRLVEAPDETNPFLLAVFYLAFDEWCDKLSHEQAELLDLLGMERPVLGDPDIEEAEALFRARLADPEKRAALEAYYDAHPMLFDATQAETWRLERESVRLLERDDAARLHMAREEVEPWLLLLLERIEPLEAWAKKKPIWGRRQQSARIRERVSEAFGRVIEEMARAIFAPERIKALVSDLRAYHRELVEKGEEQAARLVHAAWIPLDSEGIEAADPAERPLLTAICFASLQAAMGAIEEQADSLPQ